MQGGGLEAHPILLPFLLIHEDARDLDDHAIGEPDGVGLPELVDVDERREVGLEVVPQRHAVCSSRQVLG